MTALAVAIALFLTIATPQFVMRNRARDNSSMPYIVVAAVFTANALFATIYLSMPGMFTGRLSSIGDGILMTGIAYAAAKALATKTAALTDKLEISLVISGAIATASRAYSLHYTGANNHFNLWYCVSGATFIVLTTILLVAIKRDNDKLEATLAQARRDQASRHQAPMEECTTDPDHWLKYHAPNPGPIDPRYKKEL